MQVNSSYSEAQPGMLQKNNLRSKGKQIGRPSIKI